jgi:hypothetical protein
MTWISAVGNHHKDTKDTKRIGREDKDSGVNQNRNSLSADVAAPSY